MKRTVLGAMCALLMSTAAFAADLPQKTLTAPVMAAASSGFYFGVIGGSASPQTGNTNNANGSAPTGYNVGAAFGWGGTTGMFTYGLNLEAVYDFSQAQVGTVGEATTINRKNGFLLQEGAEFGVSLSTVTGTNRSTAAASRAVNWPTTITVPQTVWDNLVVAARVGAAQRDVQMCSTDNAGSVCENKFLNGYYGGVKIKTMVAGQTETFVVWDHMFWGNQQFGGIAGAPSLKQENTYRTGVLYHF